MNFLRKVGWGLGGALSFGAILATVAWAATFNQFSPATGVLKGNSGTYVTTAAVAADIRGLWSGTCDLTTFLRGDGACAQVSLTTNVTGTLPVINGGTGAATLTGLALGNGTSPFSAYTGTSCTNQFPRSLSAAGVATCATVSLTADVTGTLPFGNGGTGLASAADDTTMVSSGAAWVATNIPNCTDATGNHLNYTAATNSFSCGTSAPGGFTGFANPTASLGLTAVNGSAVTAMRSDAAPALSQSITPTWTGAHTWSGAAINTAQGSDIASAGTINLDTATGNVVDVTGTTTITAVTLSQGRTRLVRFTGTLTLTNGASLVLPGGVSITTAAGDYATFVGYSGGVVRVSDYQRAQSVPLSGVYTPTLTAVANVAAFTAYPCQYMRIGSVVTVGCRVDIDPTTTGNTQLGISLPFASNFTSTENAAGGAGPVAISGEAAGVLGDSVNDRFELRYIAVDTGNKAWFFSATYVIQ